MTKKPPSVQVVIPTGETYTDSEGALYKVVDLADIDARSLAICRAVASAAGRGRIMVVGNDDVETFLPDDFRSSGLGPVADGPPPAPRRSSDAEHRGYQPTQPRFGKWEK